MSKANQKLPSYRRQKRPTGDLAFVELGGQRVYLGRYNSPESKTQYAKRLTEWTASGKRLPVPADDLSVVELCAAHRDYAEKYYSAGSKELTAFKTIAAAMTKLYREERVAELGPLKFKAVRQELMSTPDKRRKNGDPRNRSRTYINKLWGLLKRMISWGVSEELVPPSVFQALKTVPSLRRGRTDLPETEPVTPVDDSVVDATCEYLTPTVVAMVRLQQNTGARPDEICMMRSRDVDTKGAVWTYKPTNHKTANRGKARTVFIGPKGQAILKPFLRKELEAFIFSPVQSVEERLKLRHNNRKTKEGQGNERGTNKKRHPKKKPSAHYTTATYTRAIQYACRAAFGKDNKAMHWSANQLRHSFATRVRREDRGLEAAQVLLGHAKADTTQVYAERDVAIAKAMIAKIG